MGPTAHDPAAQAGDDFRGVAVSSPERDRWASWRRNAHRTRTETTMTVQLNPYLNFRDNAREAMEFYHSVFGGTLDVSTFKEFGAAQEPSEENLVMHSQLQGEHGVVFMAADTPHSMEYQPGGAFNMSLSGDDETVLRGWFDKLADGGSIAMPLEKAPWGDIFGMCADRFGINWLVNISGQSASS
jgi:PhnB protein